jgi:REP element-mobilizing transposase RayT
MPRLPRSELSTYTYFQICAKGNNGQELFLDDQDRTRYLSLIEKYRLQYDMPCFAYCLMTNHIHLLLRCPSVQTLSKIMQRIQIAYVVYFNRRHSRKGHLFQDRFESWVIKNEQHLFATKEYIENNPLRAGMVARNEDYAWSSSSRNGSLVTLSQISD